MQNFQMEQNIRTLVDAQLTNLGWKLDYKDKDYNVYQEQPRTKEEKNKLKGKRPDYVLYSSKDKYRKEPLIIIETKKPGENLEDALRQGDWYAEQLNAPMVFATDGIYYKTIHTKYNKPLYLNGEEIDELIRELEAIKFLENNEIDTISKEVQYDRQQLISIFEEANNLLRDEGFRAGIERFGEFSNILFLKLIGELEDLKEEEGRDNEVVLEKYLRWSQWKNKKGKELLSFINDTVLINIGKAYKDEDIFTPLRIKNPEVLKKIIDKLDPLNLINIDSDIKGDSFEYFLKKSTATKNDLGEYFTPRHIVKTMVKLINPQIGETIYDPFCGTGGTLIESFKHISANMARTSSNWKKLREETLFGNEITTTARITKMNMILIGDGHSGIKQLNSLQNPVDGDKEKQGYDIVITNMPYSQKTEYGALYDLPSTNGDSICIQHCIKAIDKTSENGRMALVVPEGFLFRKDLQKTREYLLDRCTLKSIISLPQGVFLPYTAVKTNILYCTDVKKRKEQEKIWYFDVKNDGYSLDNHRRKIDGENDLQKFLAYRNTDIQEKRDIMNVGFFEISIEEVKKNDLVLSGNRYQKILNYNNIPWDTYDLGDICEFIRGITFSSSQEVQKGDKNTVAIITTRSAQDFGIVEKNLRFINKKLIKEDDKLVRNGDILISLANSLSLVGRVTFVKDVLQPMSFGAFMGLIRPNTKKVHPLFLYYLLRSEYSKEIFKKNAKTTTNISNLSFSSISNLKLPLPSLKEQEDIVNEFNSYQKIIEGAKQIIDNWKPQINSDFNWKKVKLGDFCDLMTGGTPKSTEKSYYENGDINWLVSGDIHQGEIFDCEGKITNEGLKNSNARFLPINSVLIALNGHGKTRGNVALLRIKATCNQSIVSIIPKNNNLLIPEFLYYQLKTKYQEIRDLTGDDQRSGLNMPIIRNIQIYLPLIEYQKEIVNKLNLEQKIIDENKKMIEIFENKIRDKIDSILGK